MEPSDFLGKTIIVTGAASGVGKAIATRFMNGGGDVVVADIDLNQAKETAESLNGSGTSYAVQVDVRDEQSVKSMIDYTLKNCDSLDVLVNNAGIFQKSIPSIEQSLEEWTRVMDVHVQGTYLCSKMAAIPMLEQKQGAIVNISSNAGFAAFPYRTGYSTAKAAINMLTKVFAIEWASDGVRVNAIAPNFVEKDRTIDRALGEETVRTIGGGADLDSILARTPTHRLTSLGSISESVAFLASDKIPDVTGAILPVDGGWTAYGYY